MNIIPDFLPDSILWSDKTKDGNWNKGRDGAIPRIIVLHATVDNNVNSSRNWFRTRRSSGKAVTASSHYIIAPNGDIYQEVREEDTAYHAGVSEWNGAKNINDISIGIEFTNLNNGKDPYDPAQYHAGVELVGNIVQRYNITRDNVPTHHMIAPTRKTDPYGFPYEQFLIDVFSGANPWTAWGTLFPLPVEQYQWLAPQTWLKNQWLGSALSRETYIDDNTSLTTFEHGALLYHKPENKVSIIRY